MTPSPNPALGDVRLDHGWLAERARLVRERVIPYQWEALNDRVAGAERSGTVSNFQIAAGEKAGEHHGYVFQDSDLYKWIEAASHRLATHPDPELDRVLDGIIATLGRAQRPDGYLNTHYQLREPDRRWTNLVDNHELYCAGHMFEAAVAHFEATGKRSLLGIAERCAALIARTFGTGSDQRPGYCGHEEIELALVKLWRATGNREHLRQASYFIDQRGQEPNYFAEETRRRGEPFPWHFYFDGLGTVQAAQPVRSLTEPVGHAVRMMYLATAMADLARENHDEGLCKVIRGLWDAVVARHLYVTGGVGAEPHGEKFAEPFDLPPDRAYAETCAAIGLVFFARRMLALEQDGKYADTMERALYNNVLAGLSVDGTRYFYVNPLEVVPAVARRRHDCHRVKTQRVPWFGCACCPPNVARLLASIGQYLCSPRAEGLAVHLYAGAEMRAALPAGEFRLRMRTEYPWQETVEIEILAAPTGEATLELRLPGWCRSPVVALNGAESRPPVAAGYALLRRNWKVGDRVTLKFPMPVERVRANPAIAEVAGQVALQRGPVVYCVEEIDNGPRLSALVLPPAAAPVARWDAGLLGGCLVIESPAQREEMGASLYSTVPPARRAVTLRAVPYALWANRGEGEMRVWLRES